MKKYLFAACLSLSAMVNVAQANNCPPVSSIQYVSGNTYKVPAGWSVLNTPSPEFNSQPTQWLEAAWGGLKPEFHPDHIQCVYQVEKYYPNSAGGALVIINNQVSVDPWKTQPHTIWVDNDSHVKYPNEPWDFCQSNTGGSQTTCQF